MAGRGRDSKSVEAPRAVAGEVRGRGEPSPSGGRPANRELAPGPPSPPSQRNPRVGRPPQAETKSRGTGGKVVGWRRGRAAGAGFVRLGLGRLRPAAFPPLCGARQSRGLRGHRRLPGGSGAGSRGRGSSWGERGPPPITQVGGGRAGAVPASVVRGSEPRGGCRREEEGGRLRGGGLGPQERRRVRAGARLGRFDAPPRRGEPAVPSATAAAAAAAAANPSQGWGGNSGSVGANQPPWYPNSSRHRKPP